MTANRFYLTYKCNAENLMLKKGIYQHYKGQLYQVQRWIRKFEQLL